ncbi:hypothetical protein ASD31_00450 [Rhizobium sp. Root482]|nr:hypothetical protein ASD31_00450 [Rhizobium sp. Root482]
MAIWLAVLHGAPQTAAGYDEGSGWSRLAEDYGFAVLFPEPSQDNNAILCFNWFNDDLRGLTSRFICHLIGAAVLHRDQEFFDS